MDWLVGAEPANRYFLTMKEGFECINRLGGGVAVGWGACAREGVGEEEFELMGSERMKVKNEG